MKARTKTSTDNETVEDIVREMRNPTTQDWEKPDEAVLSLTDSRTVVAHYADRIEAAHRREKAKLTNALEKIYRCVNNKRGVDASSLVKSIIADALGMSTEGGAK